MVLNNLMKYKKYFFTLLLFILLFVLSACQTQNKPLPNKIKKYNPKKCNTCPGFSYNIFKSDYTTILSTNGG